MMTISQRVERPTLEGPTHIVAPLGYTRELDPEERQAMVIIDQCGNNQFEAWRRIRSLVDSDALADSLATWAYSQRALAVRLAAHEAPGSDELSPDPFLSFDSNGGA